MITSMTNPQAPQQLFLFTILALHVLTHIRSGQSRLRTSWVEILQKWSVSACVTSLTDRDRLTLNVFLH